MWDVMKSTSPNVLVLFCKKNKKGKKSVLYNQTTKKPAFRK